MNWTSGNLGLSSGSAASGLGMTAPAEVGWSSPRVRTGWATWEDCRLLGSGLWEWSLRICISEKLRRCFSVFKFDSHCSGPHSSIWARPQIFRTGLHPCSEESQGSIEGQWGLPGGRVQGAQLRGNSGQVPTSTCLISFASKCLQNS